MIATGRRPRQAGSSGAEALRQRRAPRRASRRPSDDAVAVAARGDPDVGAERAAERVAEPAGGLGLVGMGAARPRVRAARARRGRSASRARASVSRTVQPSAAAARARRRRSSWSDAISSARPWPSLSVPAVEQVEHLVGQVEQPQQVRDRDARAADAAADVLAREPELLDEQRAGARLLDRVEVLAGHVLDQRELERLGVVVRRARAPGRVSKPGELGGAPAALAGDQLVGAARRPGARAPAAGRRARAAIGQREQRGLVEAPAAAGAGSARSARPGARAARARGSPPPSAGRSRTGSRRGRGPCRACAQPRAATSLASSK